MGSDKGLEKDKSEKNVRHKQPNTDYEIHLDQVPSPYVGNRNAPVVLLNINPGYAPEYAEAKVIRMFQQAARNNLLHLPVEYPFYPLDSSLASSASGYCWWIKILGPLMERARMPLHEFSVKIFCIEYFPYHSRRYGWTGKRLPSQDYSFTLLRRLLKRKAVIVIMRGAKYWETAVPELKSYELVYKVKNWRRPFISEGNLGRRNFQKVIAACRESDKK